MNMCGLITHVWSIKIQWWLNPIIVVTGFYTTNHDIPIQLRHSWLQSSKYPIQSHNVPRATCICMYIIIYTVCR